MHQRYHAMALERAEACADIAESNQPPSLDVVEVLQACDRQALMLEAIGHHFLQDAWSMGHMWQGWGSPSFDDFSAASEGYQINDLAKTLGIARGIIHGAKAVSGIDDALCAPGVNIEYRLGSDIVAGAGDLFWPVIEDESGNYGTQRRRLLSCSVAGQREVYAASARSFGPLAPAAPGIDTVIATSEACFGQRATNRAMDLAAGIDLSADEVTQLDLSPAEQELLRSYRIADAIEAQFLPLTAEMLGQLLVPERLRARWADDMNAIRRAITRGASQPTATTLADGGLGPLLGLKANGGYHVDDADYFDPTGAWGPSSSPNARAGDAIVRTFNKANLAAWCPVMTVDGSTELSLHRLRDRCRDESLDDDLHAAACDICTEWSKPHVLPPGETTTLCSALGVEGAVTLPFQLPQGINIVLSRDDAAANQCGAITAVVGTITMQGDYSSCAEISSTLEVDLKAPDGEGGTVGLADATVLVTIDDEDPVLLRASSTGRLSLAIPFDTTDVHTVLMHFTDERLHFISLEQDPHAHYAAAVEGDGLIAYSNFDQKDTRPSCWPTCEEELAAWARCGPIGYFSSLNYCGFEACVCCD